MKKNIDERLIKAYVAGFKYTEIARRCGIPVGLVGSRLTLLREKGVDLPRRTRPRRVITKADVARLNALVTRERRRSRGR